MLIVSTTACTSLLQSHDVTPSGLARGDDQLRRLLAEDAAGSALNRFHPDHKNSGAPSDDLLRALYKGMLSYHSGQLDSSAFLLDRAALLLEDRTGAFRVSREAAALLSNDRALPWQPGTTELLLVPYYGALSYLRAGNVQEAAVEARRLSYALESLAEKETQDKKTRGFLRYFAGLVFEAADEPNDAAVAYRNAQLLLGDAVAVAPAGADSGDVVIVIEEGFVAHKYEQSVTIVLGDDEAHDLRGDDRRRRDDIAELVALRALGQVLQPATAYEEGPRVPRRHWKVSAPGESERRPHRDCEAQQASADSTAGTSASSSTGTAPAASAVKASGPAEGERCNEDHDGDFYLLRLAWPSYHTVRRPSLRAQVLVDNTAYSVPWFVSISDAVAADFERERTRVLARTIARAAAKAAVTQSARKSVGKKNEDLGKLLGTIANISGAVLEQADTRSWTLLPGGIGLLRLRLPVGEHKLALEMDGSSHPLSSRRTQLGPVQVTGGGLQFVTARNWQ